MNGGNQTDNDLQFPMPQNGFTIDPPQAQGHMQQAHTVDAVLDSPPITVTCLDYGAHGTIGAQTNIGGQMEGARPRVLNPNPPPVTIVLLDRFGAGIPVDDNGNCIADGTQWDGGPTTPANEDKDASPLGDGTKGDGFSRYEEYRGFIQQPDAATWFTTDPTWKDMFVVDYSAIGTAESFPGTGMPEVHLVYSVGGGRVVNFNAGTAHVRNQPAAGLVYGIRSEVEFWYGQCDGSLWSGNGLCWIHEHRIREDTVLYGHTFEEGRAWAIGHELGHTVLWDRPDNGHHGANNDMTEPDCLIWYRGEFWRTTYPTTFCVLGQGDLGLCRYRWKLVPQEQP
jgi:hypothetical protein